MHEPSYPSTPVGASFHLFRASTIRFKALGSAMNNDIAGVGGEPGHWPGHDQDLPRDHARLQRRAVFLSELESARRMIARARESDRAVMARELLGRRPMGRSPIIKGR
jgi:hypothetical protein